MTLLDIRQADYKRGLDRLQDKYNALAAAQEEVDEAEAELARLADLITEAEQDERDHAEARAILERLVG